MRKEFKIFTVLAVLGLALLLISLIAAIGLGMFAAPRQPSEDLPDYGPILWVFTFLPCAVLPGVLLLTSGVIGLAVSKALVYLQRPDQPE